MLGKSGLQMKDLKVLGRTVVKNKLTDQGCSAMGSTKGTPIAAYGPKSVLTIGACLQAPTAG